MSKYSSPLDTSSIALFAQIVSTAFIVGSLAASLASAQSAQPAQHANHARDLFIQLEKTTRARSAGQAGQIEHIYKNMVPNLFFSQYAYSSRIYRPLNLDRKKLSPTQMAAKIESNGGWPALMTAAKKQARDLMLKHKKTLLPFVLLDLKSTRDQDITRALFIIGQLALTDAYDAALNVFSTNARLESYAAHALGRIGDRRAIKPLIEKHPDNPMAHFEIIRSLHRRAPAHPLVIKLLDHADPDVRWRAAYTLAESADPVLVDHVRKWVKDSDARVREQVVHVGFSLKGKAYDRVRPDLITLLEDKNRKVRVAAATRLAAVKDAACAPALLQLIKDGSQPHWQHSNVVQSVHTLTGSYFGYHIGSDAWKPDTQNNRHAIKQFATWVQTNSR